MIPDEIPESAGSVIGHNSGNMLADARNDLLAALFDDDTDGKTFAQRKSEFLTSASRQVVKNRETAGAAGDTIKLAGEVWAKIDAARRLRSDPYREVHLALSREAQDFWEPVVDAMKGLSDQINTWSDAEDVRIADQQREQAEQLAAMRAASAPPAPPPPPATDGRPDYLYVQPTGTRPYIDYTDPAPRPVFSPPPPDLKPARRARIRGDLGATISAKDVVDYEIEDFSLLPEHIIKSPTVVAAILTVVKATAKHMGVPPGIRTNTTVTTQIK